MLRPPNLPRRAGKPADIDLADIQGNVLRGYTMPAAAYLFLRVVDVEKACALMARMLPQVATAAPWPSGPPATAMNVAFTFAGLRALQLPDELLASFPAAFREGMAARADRLGDRGPSAPAHWEQASAPVTPTCWSRSPRSTRSVCAPRSPTSSTPTPSTPSSSSTASAPRR
jgi:hypothetical protein